MNGTRQGKPLFALFWRLYILLGLASASAGVFLIYSQGQVLPGLSASSTPIRIVGAILIVFGVIRVANAIFQLRRMGRS